MKKCLYAAFVSVGLPFAGCSNVETVSNELQNRVDSLANIVESQAEVIALQRDTIALLKYPADQRLSKIKQLIANGDFAKAKTEMTALRRIFPNSAEASECNSLIQDVDSKIAAIEKERERIKALGFKAIKTQSDATIGCNKVAISGISIGSEFVHDTYSTYTGSSWFYNTADRGNKFIMASMSVTSTDKNPDIPTLAFYNIEGDRLALKGTFRVEMARWDDYGSYLGNEPDHKNDFAKVSTVRFKLGCELPDEDFSKPYMVVLKRSNTQSRHYDRFRNPPIWYSGAPDYPQTLSIEDFNGGNYVAIKIANLK
ncbi:MAG: hypothetical protein K2G06_02170 [Muribaculaceae bacterium]|nr:hypothetical protein [Muribaculaceae bacterium]